MQSHPSPLYGIFWFLLSLVVSSLNDLIMKSLGHALPALEIVFFRFLFGALSLLPAVSVLERPNLRLHLLRGGLLFSGISLWCYGIQVVPLSVASLLGFTIPLFTLPLAYFFLKEKVTSCRWLATIGGFLGVAVIAVPSVQNFSWISLTLIAASFLFALLDVINKKVVRKESMISMLFFSALITALLSAVPTYFVWKTPSFSQLVLLFVLGLGANLIIYCILQAFKFVEASALAPYRYFEPLLASTLGFIFFQEVPESTTIFGALLILPMTLWATFYKGGAPMMRLPKKLFWCSFRK
ncbi:DMT family transporter [Candidatus Odyssella thessalonicensis]|uniref:DMT family transporter n=1 Tax=Candidatus Odyssella thessalonicensis TaxID=84647 RepID=UPI000225B76B|nr:DMT family transporter [Candidatus Odyssella thessalonicensis]